MVDNQARPSMPEATYTRDDLNVPQRKRPKSASDSYSNERLACPFYRSCPMKHQKYRSCAGPGWSAVSRVKEHILRQHGIPIHCVRCCTLFTSETELNQHLMLPDPCELKLSTSRPVGYNKEQEKALRRRGRGPVEKQWKEVYMILFPSVPEKLIPSPRYEDSNEEERKLWLRNLDQVESHVRLEVVRRLMQENLQLPHPLENQVRRQMIDIVKGAQADAFRSYRQQDTQPMETHGLDTSCQPSNSKSAQQSQTTNVSDLEATLGAPALTEMTEGAHDRLSIATMDPFQQESGLLCSFDSSAGGHDGMGQQHEGAGWMDSQNLDTNLATLNWDFVGTGLKNS